MGNNEESHNSVNVEHPNTTSEGGGGDTSAASVPLAPAAATVVVTPGSLMAIHQQPLNHVRKVRDELDPAPHHTPSDIKVLEILKRIRDEGNVGDDDVPPPKRKPGRSKMMEHPSFVRQAPTPVLPQPASTLATTNTTSVVVPHPLDSFKVPISASITPTTANLRPKSVSSNPATTQFRPNGTTPQTILLTTNGTTPNMVTPGTSLTFIQQKSPATQPASVTAKPQQLELILPNGLRIPVSATACAAKSETKFTPIPTAKTGSLMSSSLPSATTTIPSSNQTTPTSTQQLQTPQPSSTTSISSNTQQICSCSRSKCLKLYCDCFAAGRACGESCNCRHCYNNLADDVTKQTRDIAVRTALSKNPLAFQSKIEKSGVHVLGCRCKRSHCSKGYCECYLAKIPCNQRCRCLGCSNDDGSSSNPSSTSSTTSVTSTVKPNDVQLTFITPTHMQQLGVSTGNAASSLGVIKANVLPTNTDGSAGNAPRTFTLNWPIKALTTVNGTTNLITPSTGQQSTITTSTEMPSIILPQSFLTAVANRQNSTSVQQDLLKCLSSVLPQATGGAAGTQLIVPSLVRAAAAAAAAVSSNGSQAMEGGQPTVSQSSTENRNGEESMYGKGDNSEDDDNYTGYTEEELAFMQRLQENRNSSSECTSQVRKEDSAETREDGEDTHSNHPSSNHASSVPEDISANLNSMLAVLWRGSQAHTSSQPAPLAEQQRQKACSQASERPSSVDSMSPQSAPPSLCPPYGVEERIRRPSHKSDEVLFLKQKVADLESQVAQLTELIRTQGNAMSQLSDTIERLQQQYQTLSPTISQVNSTTNTTATDSNNNVDVNER